MLFCVRLLLGPVLLIGPHILRHGPSAFTVAAGYGGKRRAFVASMSDEVQIHLEAIWSSWANEVGHKILRTQEKKK